ncbi:TIGR04255 family protein [Microbacterium sp.]|uniref:TIGR04255 family protein n=1 Tax=Microbacterium sp. TaxID=51671 RepID=UPI003735E4C1
MTETYARAPIVEASLLMRLQTPEDISVAEATETFEKLTTLAIKERQAVFEVSNTLVAISGSDSSLDSSHRAAGFVFIGDGERISVVDDELQYSKRFAPEAPYETWEVFIQRAMVIANEAYSARGAAAVTGVGCRFVNRLPIPSADEASGFEISDYVRMSVPIPGMLPQVVRRMFAQVDIPFDDEAVSTRTTVFTDDVDEGTVLVLDIDTRRDVEPTTISEVEHYLSTIRSIKNTVFEAAITDACRLRMREPRTEPLGDD